MPFDRSEFLSTFNDEARDHLQKLNEGLLALEKDPQNAELIEEMFREGHTLKGAARMMGFDEIKEVAHCIEDIFGAIHNKQILLDEHLSTLLFQGLDLISDILELVIQSQPVDVEWEDLVNALKQTLEDYLSQKKKTKPVKKKKTAPKAKSKEKKETKESLPPEAQEETDQESEEQLAQEDDEELTFDQVKKELEKEGLLNVPLDDYMSGQKDQAQENNQSSDNKEKDSDITKSPSRSQNMEIEEFIKVPITKINKLLNLVGEMVINKINSNEKINSLRHLVKSSRILQKKSAEFSNLILNNVAISKLSNYSEIKTSFYDLNNELNKVRELTNKLFDSVSVEVSQLDPIIDELQLRMKQIRMLPVAYLFETMPRLVRDIAVAQGKKIELEISGEDTELDKKVLESIKSSLIHLLRNSVDHGIELPQERVAAGKQQKGTISLSAYHKGGNVVIEVEDDGRGLNINKIKETAVRRGLASMEEIAQLSDNDILNFIFYPGFSTAPIITDISGRGVGLDVVKNDIENLKGNINISSNLGKGTKFIMQLPLTVAIIQALIVRCENEIFAIPLLSVEESTCIQREEIYTIENRQAIRLRNKTISVVRLKDLLNVPDSHQQNTSKNKEKSFIVIINMMEKLLGIEVDEIISEQEVFIKSLDENLGKIKNVSGVTVLGSGQVIIILDVLDLFDSSKTLTTYSRRTGQDDKKLGIGTQKRILIVEDSLTTRELERSILETHGYEVDTSIDGMDALNQLQNNAYDLIVSDIEMPKMNGFELCKAVRQNKDYKEIPFIIVTSLDRESDKRRGIEVGAQAYIVKSAFDQSNLVDTIKRLIG